jgi:predicted small metal-binding protein
MGSDCDFIAGGETLEEVLQVGAEHGRAVHGINELTPEMVEQVKSIVREE